MKLFIIFVAYIFLHVAAEPQIIPIPNGLSGVGFSTTYWDCCKPSCSWSGNLPSGVASPVNSCALDGQTVLDINAMSGCTPDGSGTAYMCTNQQPWAYNDTLSLGFAGGSFTGGADVSKCCACFLISFPGSDKKLALQVTNTGSDAGINQFDIAMPGGGVGLYNGCVAQWNAPVDGWGERYGGVHSIEIFPQSVNLSRVTAGRGHLQNLSTTFSKYVFVEEDIKLGDWNWVINSFESTPTGLSLQEEEQLLDFSSNSAEK